jgi:Ca-activated chloride channel homolog
MSFTWPSMLWLLALVPVLIAVYLRVLRRQRQNTIRYAGLVHVTNARGRGPRFRRHVPALLFLLAVGASVVALARPSATLMLPGFRGTVILSLDVSGSMRAMDIKPTRMDAVKGAARTFVNAEPQGMRFGIVAFSGAAIIVQTPTTDKAEVLAAIDRLSPQMYTAIGSGLLSALDAIFKKPSGEQVYTAGTLLAPAPQEQEPPPVPPGSNTSAAIILLSDGQSNQGPDPLDAAEKAASLGVRVFTVGVGTAKGATINLDGFTFHAILDEPTLKKIALITRGRYFKASSTEELRSIYQSLGTRLGLEKQNTEITALFVAAAVALLILMGVLSILWFNRLL